MTTGVVVMAYGTPRHRDEIAAYYTDIRRGRPPSPEQLADLVARYDAIGGLSPLAARTEAQRATLTRQLDAEKVGAFVVATGLRHADPTIERAVVDVVASGADHVVGLVLAPHHSALSVGAYHERAADAAARHGVAYVGIDSWATEPAYVSFLARAVIAGLDPMPPRTIVLFTAHSLPRRILTTGDRYPAEVTATAAAVAAAAGLRRWDQWSVAWQSAGRTPEPWLGPDVLEVIDAVAAIGPGSGLLVCPCGFVADHLEVLYDLDIEARQRAERLGVAFARTPVPNDDGAVMAALARRIAAVTTSAPTGL
jgi:ferrochelatase